MGRISSSVGLISGIPIVQTVEQLIALEARPRDLLAQTTGILEQEQLLFADLSARLLSLQLGAVSLRAPTLFTERSVTSSDIEALTATSVGQPAIGTYQFTPLRLVQSQQLLSTGFVDDSSAIGEGSFSFRFGGFVDRDTNLDVLNGGEGFARGKIRITDRSGASSEIDLRFARTVDDVLETINGDSQINVRAEVAGDGFRLVDRTGQQASNLLVQEVGGGASAASLGFAGIDVAADEAVGTDVVRLFDELGLNQLNDGLGVRFDPFLADLEVTFQNGSDPLQIDFERQPVPGTAATATINSGDPESEITFTASTGGAEFAGVVIQFVDDPNVSAGAEQVAYDADLKTLTFRIDTGNTTAQNVVDALNNDEEANLIFTAGLADGSAGSGVIDVSETAITGGPVASAVLVSAGADNDLIFEAAAVGGDFDGVTITLVDDGVVQAGSESALFDPNAKTLTITIEDGQSTAAGVIAAVNAEGTFSARLDLSEGENDGSGTVQTTQTDPLATATTAGGEFLEPQPATDEFTLGQVLAALNDADPARLLAEISAAGDRIVLTDLTSDQGGAFSVTDLNDSHVVEDLGLDLTPAGGVITGRRILAGPKTSLLSSLGGGSGIGPLGLLDLADRSGQSTTVDLSATETLQEVIDAINAAPVSINARVNDARNGILLEDTTGLTSGNLSVTNGDATNSADALGIAVDADTESIGSGDLSLQVVNESTRLDTLNGGGGVALGTLSITDSNGSTSTLDLSGDDVETIGDLIIELERLGLAIEATINPSGDGVLLIDKGSGQNTLSVAEGNTTTAADLHLLGEAQQVDLGGEIFTVIDGSTKITIDIDDTESLNDLVTKINDLDAGVVATTFNDGSTVRPFRLLLASQQSGKSGELLIDTSGVDFGFSETARAQDALVLFGGAQNAASGLLATSTTNTFQNIIPGINIQLHQATGETVNVTVDSTDAKLAETVQTFVDGFNDLRSVLASATSFEPETGATGPLFGDSRALRIDTDLSRLLSGQFFGVGPIQSLGSLGIRLESDGSLTFDAEELSGEFTEDPDAVEQFFTAEDLGFAAKLETLIDQLAGDENSLLINRLDSLTATIADNNERLVFLDDRLEQSRQRLLNDFLRMEQAIAAMQNDLNALATIVPLAPL